MSTENRNYYCKRDWAGEEGVGVIVCETIPRFYSSVPSSISVLSGYHHIIVVL